MQHPNKNTLNIRFKQLKTSEKHTLATCMYIQHPDLLLQHADETLAIYF
jgi:hypothetical protein